MSRKELRGGKAYAAPLFGAIALVLFWLVLTEWQQLPSLINATIASVRWPI